MVEFLKFILISFVLVYFILLVITKRKYSKYKNIINYEKIFVDKFLAIGILLIKTLNLKHQNLFDKYIYCKMEIYYGQKNIKTIQNIYFSRRINTFILIIFITMCLFLVKELDYVILITGIIISISLAFIYDYILIRNVKKKKREIILQFPEFVTKLVLLINAGLVLKKAWEVIVSDKNNCGELYKEAQIVLDELSAGVSEKLAFENFSKRCGVTQVNKFVLVVVQGLRKGNKELVNLLKYQIEECLENRNIVAKELGEEASTKLIFPIVLIFIAILIIILTPVLINLEIFIG